ncbi:unnamed protein product [Didymodactylos carnosus]|uniref:Uncharacterized protein n=1 Tax=Didymodactylos carnosus TaxID=1234261 RepID=A0A814QRS4_9BILA|nr:unnamed protein product [Didymodactylos carnosus]CAF3887258.1 unnamed protein product [Didymodactylos carnosus]
MFTANTGEAAQTNQRLFRDTFHRLPSGKKRPLSKSQQMCWTLLLCEQDYGDHSPQWCRLIQTIIAEYFSTDQQQQLGDNTKLFLSTIIMKRSWNYLLSLLKSDFFQIRIGHKWSVYIHHLLEVKHNNTLEQNGLLHMCDRIEFTLPLSDNLQQQLIFPKLNQYFDELSKIFHLCANDHTQRWMPLLNWFQTKLTSDPCLLESNEIKALMILIIYYNYYCADKLSTLNILLETLESHHAAMLKLSLEEQRLFRVLLKPTQYMIGYDDTEENYLNKLFKLDCKADDELSIRHSMVNLMAMIVLSGKNNFLWTFAFQPLSLQNTFGFGSTAYLVIKANGVHYDCGCMYSLSP